jgi:hypothetical protein
MGNIPQSALSVNSVFSQSYHILLGTLNFKKMKNIKYIAFLLLPLSILVTSCDPEEYFTPVVEIKLPPNTPKLVVYSEMWEGQDSLTVFVTQSRGAFDNKSFPNVKDTIRNVVRINGKDTTFVYPTVYQAADTVSNPTVELYKNELLIATFKKVSKAGFHTTKLPSKLRSDGATYRLKVSANGFETVEAVQKMPTLAAIDTIAYRPKVRLTDPREPLDFVIRDEFGITFKDPAGEKNYYTAQGFFQYTSGRDSFFQYLNLYSLDPISNDNYLSDETFDGKTAVWRQHGYNFNTSTVGTKMRFYLISLNEAYYLYKLSLIRFYNAQDNPFAEPVILYTNVKNGYGLFTMGGYREYNFVAK